MSKRKYLAALKATAKAYEKDGVQAAINECEKRGYTTYAHCKPCEAKQPVIKEQHRNDSGVLVMSCDCGVCGSVIQPNM